MGTLPISSVHALLQSNARVDCRGPLGRARRIRGAGSDTPKDPDILTMLSIDAKAIFFSALHPLVPGGPAVGA